MRRFVSTLLSPIGKKGLMALSGALLGIFLLVHLLGNATAFLGRQAFLAYAENLHSMGQAIILFESALLVLFATHIILAATLYIEDCAARPQRYAVYRRQTKGWGARTMPYTGLAILLFLIVHLANFHFSGKNIPIADLILETFHNIPLALFYILSVSALALHISHGFWSMFQSMGISHPRYDALIRTTAIGASILIGTVYIMIPAMTFLSRTFLLE